MRRVLAIAGVGVALLQPAAAQTTFTTLGRLFTTPAERMALDQQRATMAPQGSGGAGTPGSAAGTAPIAGTQGAQAPAEPTPPAPPATPVRLDGVVRRSNGQATIWVDNASRETTVRGRPGAGVPVDVGGRRVLLKPGQSYDPNSGTVLDAQPAR